MKLFRPSTWNIILFFAILLIAWILAQVVKADTGESRTAYLPTTEMEAHPVEHREMLYTVVLVRTKGGSGSGTVVFSQRIGEEYHSYILTNHHVIGSHIRVTEEWDPKIKKKIQKEQRVELEATWWQYNDFSRMIGSTSQRVDIVAYDERLDLGLLRLRDTERPVQYVAELLPDGAPIYLFDGVFAIGAGLGEPPFATEGKISFLDKLIDGEEYMLSTAPIIFGNSGGALFRYSRERERHELIGVPSRVSATGWSAVTHMAWSIPMETVRGFLRDNCYQVILGEDLGDSCEAIGELKPDDE